jgi:hypothetical protein
MKRLKDNLIVLTLVAMQLVWIGGAALFVVWHRQAPVMAAAQRDRAQAPDVATAFLAQRRR